MLMRLNLLVPLLTIILRVATCLKVGVAKVDGNETSYGVLYSLNHVL